MDRQVIIIQKAIPQYRRHFFELLRERLAAQRIELALVYGQPEPAEASKLDLVELPWAHKRRSLIVPLGSRHLYWQPCLALARQADLVIVEQASKLLVNYVLLAGQMAGRARLAFWGHGRTPKVWPPSRLGEAAKVAMSRRAHWWFAYNELSASYVRELGFPAERITSVQNAIDTRSLAAAAANVTDEQVEALRARLGLSGRDVGLFVGAMYAEKRLPFLIAACELIRQRVPGFEMLFVGAGPDEHVVEEAVARNPWMRRLGPVFDADRTPLFRLAKVMLMPGGVGLGVLDCFVLATPLVTTGVSYHGPEIEYLEDGVNGLIVREANSPAAYAKEVATLLHDPAALERLRASCRASSQAYTTEDMAERFASGIESALAAPPR